MNLVVERTVRVWVKEDQVFFVTMEADAEYTPATVQDPSSLEIGKVSITCICDEDGNDMETRAANTPAAILAKVRTLALADDKTPWEE